MVYSYNGILGKSETELVLRAVTCMKVTKIISRERRQI